MTGQVKPIPVPVILAAVNEALRQAGETMEREMGKMTGGLGMPGLF